MGSPKFKNILLRALSKMLQHRQTDSSIEDETNQLSVTASGQKRTDSPGGGRRKWSFGLPTKLGAIHFSISQGVLRGTCNAYISAYLGSRGLMALISTD